MPKFSLVYPTRHRPQFVRQALRVLEQQRHEDFEVVICDNFVDPTLSCESACRESAVRNVKYVRPPRPLGMVENWNHALSHVSGEYVCYFTDKMFLLPGALTRIDGIIRRADSPEIISWASDTFTATSFDDYFGPGHYFGMRSDVRHLRFDCFDPREELNRKGHAVVPRNLQSPSHYARGKICFGAFHRNLIQRILDRYGALFHGINPDYSSMIAGLSEARDSVEAAASCVVSISTDISNGQLIDLHDALARTFLESLDATEEKMANLMVPGLYSSVSNLVAHDYLTMKARFGLDFAFDFTNWLSYCLLEVERPGREWSSPEVEHEQRRLLSTFLSDLGPEAERAVHEKARQIASFSAPIFGHRFVLRAATIDEGIAQRTARFLKLKLACYAFTRWFEHIVLGSRIIQRAVIERDWIGKDWVRSRYRRIKSWVR